MHDFAVANAHFVTDRIAVGGDFAYDDEIAAGQAAELIAAGITHVIDVRRECDDTPLWVGLPAVSYFWDGIDDRGQRVPPIWFDGVVSWALAALADPDARVLTHCHMGINRGPSAGFAVLLGLGWDPVTALDAIRSARPVAAIAYAGDALEWHFERTGANCTERAEIRRRVRTWFAEHPLDVVRIIREVRLGQAS